MQRLSLLESNLSFADVWINVESPLSVQRDALSDLLYSISRQLRADDAFLLIKLFQLLSVRIHNHAVAPRIIISLHVSRRTAQGRVNLVIHCSRPGLQFPVQSTGGQVERTGVDAQKGTFASRDGRQLREPDVIADGHSYLSVLRQVHDGDLVTGRQGVRLDELDLAGDVDVEEVHLAMRGQQLSRRTERHARVVQFVRVGCLFGNAAADDVRLCFPGQGREGVEAGRLGLAGRTRQQRFGVLGKVLYPVRRVEALGQDDNLCIVLPDGLQYFCPRVREIVRFVCRRGELDECQFHRTLQEFRHCLDWFGSMAQGLHIQLHALSETAFLFLRGFFWGGRLECKDEE
jgi:hypothetical protein